MSTPSFSSMRFHFNQEGCCPCCNCLSWYLDGCCQNIHITCPHQRCLSTFTNLPIDCLQQYWFSHKYSNSSSTSESRSAGKNDSNSGWFDLESSSSRPTLHCSVQFNLIYFEVRLGPRPLTCPSLTRLPAVGAQSISRRSDDLVVPKPPACGCEWWWRLVSPSTRGDWWASCHDESCARYSRLRCDIGVSPLLPPPFTYREGVLLGQQLRALCLETELEKRKKKGWVCPCLFPLLRGTE